VATPDQRTPAGRPVPVAADTRRLRQCPRPETSRPEDIATRPQFRKQSGALPQSPAPDTEHCRSRPVGRSRTCRRLRWTLRPSAHQPRQSLPACRKQRDPLGCAAPPGQVGARGAHASVRPGADTGRAVRTPAVPEYLAQRTPITLGRLPRTLRQPSGRIADRRPCPPRSPPDGNGPPLGPHRPAASGRRSGSWCATRWSSPRQRRCNTPRHPG
jgi:hypothetical protein